MTDEQYRALYQSAVIADSAWQAELQRRFGRDAGTVRYTQEGRTGPILAPLHAEARRTCDVWMAVMRGEIHDPRITQVTAGVPPAVATDDEEIEEHPWPEYCDE